MKTTKKPTLKMKRTSEGYVCAADPRIKFRRRAGGRWLLALDREAASEHATRETAVEAALAWLGRNPTPHTALAALWRGLPACEDASRLFAAVVAGDEDARLLLHDVAAERGVPIDDLTWRQARVELVRLGVLPRTPPPLDPHWHRVAADGARDAHQAFMHMDYKAPIDDLTGRQAPVDLVRLGECRRGKLTLRASDRRGASAFVHVDPNAPHDPGLRRLELDHICARSKEAGLVVLGFGVYPSSGDQDGCTVAMVLRGGPQEERLFREIARESRRLRFEAEMKAARAKRAARPASDTVQGPEADALVGDAALPKAGVTEEDDEAAGRPPAAGAAQAALRA
jgi:hypothetical protein